MADTGMDTTNHAAMRMITIYWASFHSALVPYTGKQSNIREPDKLGANLEHIFNSAGV